MSLVELLVAVVVLSVGLLGIAHVLVQGVRTSHAALLRTRAINLVADMAERIRANPLGGAAYELASYSDGPATQDCEVDPCSPPERAEDDLARWQHAARSALPKPESSVRFSAADASDSPARYHILVSWLEPGASGASSEQAEVVLAP